MPYAKAVDSPFECKDLCGWWVPGIVSASRGKIRPWEGRRCRAEWVTYGGVLVSTLVAEPEVHAEGAVDLVNLCC